MAEILRGIPGVKSAHATVRPAAAVVVREVGRAANATLVRAVEQDGFGARVTRVVPVP